MRLYDKPNSSKGIWTMLITVAVLCIIAITLSCCKPTQFVTNETVREVRVVEHDTSIVIEKDYAAINALLECDSNNQVILKQIDELKGSRIEPNLTIEYNGNAAELLFECNEDSLEREIHLRDSIISVRETKTVVVEKKVRSGWDKFWAWSGPVTWILIILLIALRIFYAIYIRK